jgi:hypothetical protein
MLPKHTSQIWTPTHLWMRFGCWGFVGPLHEMGELTNPHLTRSFWPHSQSLVFVLLVHSIPPPPPPNIISKKKAKKILKKSLNFSLKMVPSKPILATPRMMDPRGQTISFTCSNIMASKLCLGWSSFKLNLDEFHV